MGFKTYFVGLDKTAREDLARRCDTSVGQLQQVAYGFRRCGEKLAIAIERETAGQISCEQLRPDVDWAYLRGTQSHMQERATNGP